MGGEGEVSSMGAVGRGGSESRIAYLPRDRLESLVSGRELPAQGTGSVLFADISGFTPLTEAYEAHLGSRRGGEELTRVLNEVYALLIGEVDRMRGSVIGFAGDAITCWFDGDDGLRAVTCARAMQSGMEQFAAIPSPGGGTIALGLKAAVATGKVRRFAVGDPEIQRVDVLAGDPVYRVAAAEQASKRGEVVIDPPTLALLGERVGIIEVREERDGEPVAAVVGDLREAAEVEPWPLRDVASIDRDWVDPWMISAIRQRLGSGMGEFLTELRPATAMFVKFEGIDFEGDPGSDTKLDAFFSRVQHIVSAHEGVVHQLTLGDKGSFLYAAFGAPISHEDDTERAFAVALQLRELPAEMDFIAAVRIGISRGTTRTGAYGGPTRRTYGVLGDQVNLAARLMGKAESGQILVSDTAALECRDDFSLRALSPIRVKGKSEPVQVHELEGRRLPGDARKMAPRYSLPMVGRKEELARLTRLLEAVEGGRGQSVSLVADAGMGKSRLLEECIRVAERRGFRLLFGECPTFGANTLYTVWWSIWRDFFALGEAEEPEQVTELLRQRLRAIDPSLLSRLPLLGPVIHVPLEDNELTRTFEAKLRRASLESLLIECLRSESAKQPLLIVLDDAHAIDPVSRDLLRTIVQAIARFPVALVIAHRPNPQSPVLGPAETALEYVHSIELGEFSSAESGDLIRLKMAQLFGTRAPASPELVQTITARTGGNPFFIEEVMNWARHRNIDMTDAHALDAAELPSSLHALVLSRMDQLEESSRITLKVASVIGRLFRAALIWGVSPELGGETEVLGTLERLSRREFTVREDEGSEVCYLFKHVVIHEVAYESLTHRLRSRIHEAIGLFIEAHLSADSARVLDLLAFHFGRSPNLEKKREYLLRAGDAARLAYANSAAANHYQAVLPLLEGQARIPVMQNLGRVLEITGDWKQAMENYRGSLELAEAHGQALAAAHGRLLVGDLLRKTGAFDEAADWLAQAQAAFAALGDDSGIGQSLHSEGTLAAQTGQYERARELYEQSMAIRRRLGDELKAASLLSNIGIIVRFQGDLQRALAIQQESLEIRRRLKDPWAIGNSLNNLGMALRYTGDLSGARAALEEGLRILREVGDRSEIANALNSLAEIALDQQDSEACEQFLNESLRLTRELGNLRALAYLFEAFASNAFFQRRPGRALLLIGAARALRESIGAPLPEADQDRIEEIVDLASSALHDADPQAQLSKGAALPLSSALDYAAGLTHPPDNPSSVHAAAPSGEGSMPA